MKPIALKGHERAITQIKYNRDGDLIFSASKDAHCNVWFSDNGERLGTYSGHKGVVWCMDVNWDSANILTGSGDNQCILWDCQTGKIIHALQMSTAVRTVGFSYSGHLFFNSTDQRMSYNCSLNIFDTRDRDAVVNNTPQISIPVPKSKVTSAIWSHLDDMIVTGHDNGEICQYDLRSETNEPVNFVQEHKKSIKDIQCSLDQIMIISSGADHSAKLFDASTLQFLKTYKSEKPVNSAAVSPIKDHVILGGGEEAMTVTQTAQEQGQFEAKLYHLIFEDEFARIKGHFGPINTIMFHPDGKSYASGAEDGYVRINKFDKEYFQFDLDY